jgi:hypothetical protein
LERLAPGGGMDASREATAADRGLGADIVAPSGCGAETRPSVEPEGAASGVSPETPAMASGEVRGLGGSPRTSAATVIAPRRLERLSPGGDWDVSRETAAAEPRLSAALSAPSRCGPGARPSAEPGRAASGVSRGTSPEEPGLRRGGAAAPPSGCAATSRPCAGPGRAASGVSRGTSSEEPALGRGIDAAAPSGCTAAARPCVELEGHEGAVSRETAQGAGVREVWRRPRPEGSPVVVGLRPGPLP